LIGELSRLILRYTECNKLKEADADCIRPLDGHATFTERDEELNSDP